MRLQTYQDESCSRRLNLIGGGGHPWSIDLVSLTASGILLVGFACALVAQCVGRSTLKREVYCVNRKATASIAIKPAINNNEIVAAILFALGLSFQDRRP
jgi:hypothetical protein